MYYVDVDRQGPTGHQLDDPAERLGRRSPVGPPRGRARGVRTITQGATQCAHARPRVCGTALSSLQCLPKLLKERVIKTLMEPDYFGSERDVLTEADAEG